MRATRSHEPSINYQEGVTGPLVGIDICQYKFTTYFSKIKHPDLCFQEYLNYIACRKHLICCTGLVPPEPVSTMWVLRTVFRGYVSGIDRKAYLQREYRKEE